MASDGQPRSPESGQPVPGWHGLSDEAQSALIRRSVGPSPASQLLTETSATRPEELEDPILQWARTELETQEDSEGAFARWEKHADLLRVPVPASVEDMLEQSPQLAGTLERLFRAKQALTHSRRLTPAEENIGSTMHLVLVPWQSLERAFERGLQGGAHSLRHWVDTCRQRLDSADSGFAISDERLTDATKPFTSAFFEDPPMYRGAKKPAELQRLSEYLAAKVAENGPWGLILTQTGESGGYYGEDASTSPQYAGDWTNDGKSHYQIAGYNVDAMGVFEYMAYVLQGDTIEEKVSFMLLANRVRGYGRSGNDWGVPFGYYTGPGSKIGLLLRRADSHGDEQSFAEPPRILLTVGGENV